ncbi:uncharacterized protein LOC105421447 [Amborella trichopoda]|uniref:uncharacterized protein LOC105421447 n=1 Tax=Amborella trichopoda TaxID=13333 RepID=UPI0005D3FF9E|nr:uncharacterized protein LOC105421447 [Amborella trichopoda]|eukprot:XP_011627184.1 uncharacterized protein LOC105421447 [Amborella trichopoda]
MNKHFKMYIASSTSLRTLLEVTTKVQDKKVRKEREKDLRDIDTTPILRTTSFIEAQTAKIYTQKIMKRFGEEVKNVFEIPPQYIMRHWRKDIKNGVFIDESGNQIQETSQLPRSIRYNEVYHATRYLVERVSESTELHEFIMAILRSGICQVDSQFGHKGGPHNDVTINCNAEEYGNVEANANIDENAASCSDKPIESEHCQNILEPPQA